MKIGKDNILFYTAIITLIIYLVSYYMTPKKDADTFLQKHKYSIILSILGAGAFYWYMMNSFEYVEIAAEAEELMSEYCIQSEAIYNEQMLQDLANF
jgi:hypothetical protein